ncbi:MAG: hypothetical protein GXP24_07740 [Planctomycetes bacterium]|nr:hypothetical protein [Planctomycetota bacterium]
MTRSNQQLVRLLQTLIRAVQSGKLKIRWIVALVVLAVGYFLLQPVLERSLGVDLPGLGDLTKNTQTGETPTKKTATVNTPTPRPADASASGELEKILRAGSRAPYVSPAGLRYTRGSKQGHRLKHVMAHAQDAPDRPGQHGVFDSNDPAEVVALVDEAYLQAQTGRDTRTQREEERTVYDVNLRRRIGYIGGTSGKRKNHPAAKHLRLVVEGDRVITAFPVRP